MVVGSGNAPDGFTMSHRTPKTGFFIFSIMSNKKEVNEELAKVLPLESIKDGKLVFPLEFDSFADFGVFQSNLAVGANLLNQYAYHYGDGSYFDDKNLTIGLSSILEVLQQTTYKMCDLFEVLDSVEIKN